VCFQHTDLFTPNIEVVGVKDKHQIQNDGSGQAGAADVILGRPTVAANAGTRINSMLNRTFDAVGLGEAEWIRLPSPRARCRLTGLSRTGLNELVDGKLIKAIKVRKPGAQRGVVLINRASLLGYLAKLDADQNGGGVL
jgi:hypothetical protein